jgi:hypothetical protein
LKLIRSSDALDNGKMRFEETKIFTFVCLGLRHSRCSWLLDRSQPSFLQRMEMPERLRRRLWRRPKKLSLGRIAGNGDVELQAHLRKPLHLIRRKA